MSERAEPPVVLHAVGDIALGDHPLCAGFGSVRRFNETFRALFQRPPSALRRKTRGRLATAGAAEAAVTLRLRYRAPYVWEAMLAELP